MKYLYILLICLILFYLISRYFEKYYSQENFDPSLVPVSSIITLAKVAQKIVDGNGTLTNPANLNIGTTSAKGNLLVTGNTTTNGNKQIDGTLGVTGATTLSNTLGVTGNTTVGGTLGVTGATTVGSTLGVTGATTLTGGVTGGLNVTGATTLGTSGTPATTTSLTVNGTANVSSLKLGVVGGGATFANGTASPDNTIVKFGDGSGWRMKFAHTDGADTGTYIYDNGSIVSPTITAAQTLNVAARGGQQGYSLYSQTGDYFGIWRNGDLFTVDSAGNAAFKGNKITQGNIITVKYGGVCNGSTYRIPVPKYPCKFTYSQHSGGAHFYQTGIWDETGAWGDIRAGDSQLTTPPAAGGDCVISQPGTSGGGWFMTLEYPV